jgi:DNA-directed RNA polymerase specialized sigma24 family protein
VAYRLLESLSEADDAVQEAWPQLTRAGTSHGEDLPEDGARGEGDDAGSYE